MPVIINGQEIATLKLGTSQIANVFQGTAQNWANEFVLMLGASGAAAYAADLFEAAKPGVWASSTPKRLVVPQGVERGSAGTWVLAIVNGAQAASYGGSLTIEVAGTLSGIGGAPNSGVGGDVIWANVPGKDGQQTAINVLTTGLLRSGGGGGGKAGNGGGGYYSSPYTVTEGPFFNYSDSSSPKYYCGIEGAGSYYFWNGTQVGGGGWKPRPYSYGGYVYTNGPHWSGTIYRVQRSYTAYQTIYTSGGVAGNAGRGQGYDGAATNGAAAVAGGTNAGASGKSGNGGGYGASGQTGANGANGNNGSGTAGVAGGLAGFYLKGAANAVLTNEGTVLGRVQ